MQAAAALEDEERDLFERTKRTKMTRAAAVDRGEGAGQQPVG